MPLWDLEKENQPARDASLSLLPRCVSRAALVPALPARSSQFTFCSVVSGWDVSQSSPPGKLTYLN